MICTRNPFFSTRRQGRNSEEVERGATRAFSRQALLLGLSKKRNKREYVTASEGKEMEEVEQRCQLYKGYHYLI